MKSRRTYSYLLGAVVIVFVVLWLKSQKGSNETSINATELVKENLNPRVKVTVVYETLCPDSMAFVKNQLWPTYQKLGSILSIDLVPWGKAAYKSAGDTWTFTCQHGAQECYGNKVHACVLAATDIDTSMRFVQCSMSSRDPVTASQACVNDVGLDWQKISVCANGPFGNSLLHKYGVRSEKLNPPLIFVPWILINDNFSDAQLERSLENLPAVVCNAYQGRKPEACLRP